MIKAEQDEVGSLIDTGVLTELTSADPDWEEALRSATSSRNSFSDFTVDLPPIDACVH